MDLHFSYIGPFIDFKLSLPDKGLVALVGSSGTGKSSLLSGIHWILTGEPRNITHINVTSKSKIFASLSYRGLKIVRHKKPDRLEVREGDVHLDNKDTAQTYLNKKFGQNNVIEASSYLSQKSFHSLLQLSSSDRLSLISNLVWTETSPEDHIDKVDKQLKSLMDKLPNLTAEVDYTRKQLNEEKEKYDWNNYIPDNDYLQQIKNNENLIEEQKKQKNKHHQILGKLSGLEQQINKINYHNHHGQDIDELKIKLKRLQRQQSLTGSWKKSIDLQAKLVDIPDYQIDTEKYQLKKIIRQEVEYQQQKTLAEKYKIEYTSEGIKVAVATASNDEKLYSYQQTQDKIKNLESKLQICKYTLEELNILKQQSLLLKCPNCETSLKYQDNQLIISNTKISNEKINFEEEIKKCKKYQQDLSAIQGLKSLLPEVEIMMMPTFKLEEAKEILNLKYIPEPSISSKKFEQVLERQQILEKIKMLGPIDNDFSPGSSLEELKQEIKTLEDEINKVLKWDKEYQQYCQLILEREKLEIEIKQLCFDEDYLLNLEKENEKLKLKLREIQEMKQWKIKEEKLLPKEQELKDLRLDIEDFGIIREKMGELQYKLLDNALVELNLTLTLALEGLFTENVKIEVSRFKEGKSNGHIKSSINLLFKLKGLESDNIRV